MATNYFIPFATGNGATVVNDPAWASSGVVPQGFQNGVADPALVNKALRQSTSIAALIGQFGADYSAQDFTDGLPTTTLRDNFRIALAAAQAGAYFAQDTSSTANVVNVSLAPVPPALNGYVPIIVRVANTSTGPVTINYAAGNPASPATISKPLVRRNGTPMQSGDLVAGSFLHAGYDTVTGSWRALGTVQSDNASGLAGLTPQQRGMSIVTSGTYTILSPTVKVWAVGGGGGGNTTYGGGAGASLIAYLTGLTVGGTLTVQIGAGGAGSTGSTGGGNAGSTIISSGTQTISTLTAGGGLGPVAGSGNAGFGGIATGGTIYNGQGNGGSTGIGGIAQPYGPFGNGGSAAMNGIIVNGTTIGNNNGAQGIAVFEAVS